MDELYVIARRVVPDVLRIPHAIPTPDIQAQILRLESLDGVEPITERAVRRVVRASGWEEQRGAWQSLQNPIAQSVFVDYCLIESAVERPHRW